MVDQFGFIHLRPPSKKLHNKDVSEFNSTTAATKGSGKIASVLDQASALCQTVYMLFEIKLKNDRSLLQRTANRLSICSEVKNASDSKPNSPLLLRTK